MILDLFTLFILATTPVLTAIVRLKRDTCGANDIVCENGVCINRDWLCKGADGNCAEGKEQQVCSLYQSLYFQQFGNCILPAFPKNGRYVVAGAPNAYAGQILKNARLTVTCDSGYEIVGERNLNCNDGSWSAKKFPKCNKAATPIAPWHASFYRKTSPQYRHACGGSLISTTAVISAAICFWNHRDQRVQPESLYAAAVGKQYQAWINNFDIEVQVSDVQAINIPSTFKGLGSHLNDDIAVIWLATAVVYRDYVRPVWVDFNIDVENSQLREGKMGKIATWRARNGSESDVLSLDMLPFTKNEQCSANTNAKFLEYITNYKICATYRDDTQFCFGDKGGGLVFSETYGGMERFYLRGVLSAAPSYSGICASNTIAVFTKISKYETFIKQYWSF